ncbi:hypothetical protein AND_002983 [Anopheles darlingi]|uniref:Reticulon/nogo receptor n=1 Tax=Anopheles darlingi TaxID=43151 RepID=W5JLK3_ANODA|nr:hypothetical protein AND_002983 [Anopheles darlingi]
MRKKWKCKRDNTGQFPPGEDSSSTAEEQSFLGQSEASSPRCAFPAASTTNQTMPIGTTPANDATIVLDCHLQSSTGNAVFCAAISELGRHFSVWRHRRYTDKSHGTDGRMNGQRVGGCSPCIDRILNTAICNQMAERMQSNGAGGWFPKFVSPCNRRLRTRTERNGAERTKSTVSCGQIHGVATTTTRSDSFTKTSSTQRARKEIGEKLIVSTTGLQNKPIDTMASTITAYRHLSLALLVLCIVTSPTESRYREKDAKKSKGATLQQQQQQQHHNMPPMVIPSPLMNLCSGDREMKLVCHCSPDDPHVKAQKANCWIFSKELPRKDANWLAFQTQSTLEQLKITVQKIGNLAYIPSDVLHTLKYLRQLTIEYGVIPDLQNYAFGNLTELRNVTLHKNQIRLVHPFAFANHPHLEEINLERNEIIELDKEALLKLESNQITVLTREIFKGLGNLRILKLTANSLSFIGDTIFAELWSLQELDLDHNQIEKLSARAFDGLNNLRKLNLENNRLKRLERGIFTGVPAVLNLNLNSNQLETITYNNFLPLMDNLVNSTAILHLKDRQMGPTGLMPCDVGYTLYATATDSARSTRSFEVYADMLPSVVDGSVLKDTTKPKTNGKNNRFICDCRLLWLFDLRNSTKNDVLRQALQQIECLHDFKGISLIYGGPALPPAPPNQLLPNHLKDYGRGPAHELIIDHDYYDETGGHHRPPKPSVAIQKKFSSARSAGDATGGGAGVGAAAAADGDKATDAGLQTVKLMSLRKDTILPCPKELDEPTELPLSRESIGLDMGWRSSVTATSAAGLDRFPGWMIVVLLLGRLARQGCCYWLLLRNLDELGRTFANQVEA